MLQRRMLQLVPVLLGVTFITFMVLNLLPGNVAVAILGTNATRQSVTQLDQQLGLNHPLFVRYFDWLGSLLRGDLGHSLITNQSVASILRERAPVTLELLIFAFVLALVFAIPSALLWANKPRGVTGRVAGAVTLVGLSVPNFLVGLVLILVLAVRVKVFPATGYTPLSQSVGGNLRTMFLPALSMGFVLYGTYTRMLRADMSEQLSTEDYVAAARAKGVRRRVVLLRHVLRNSLLGLVTVVGVNFGALFGATVIIEDLFALPGVGQLLVTSIYNKDAPTVQGVVMIMAVVVVVVNLLTDLLYAVIDPRVRNGRSDT
jgi:peptide/nickel transport system permease protein